MWSKGARNDYLDIYDEGDEEYDEYYEEETKPKQQAVEVKPIELKVEDKPVVTVVTVVETKVDEIIQNFEYSSDEDDNYNTRITGPIVYEVNDTELMFDNYSDFSYNDSMDLYKKYRQENSAQNIIKRFGFKKLKSKDNNHYYLDKTLYFVWKYRKNIKTGEEELVRVDDEMWNMLKRQNENIVMYDRYLPQPALCF